MNREQVEELQELLIDYCYDEEEDMTDYYKPLNAYDLFNMLFLLTTHEETNEVEGI